MNFGEEGFLAQQSKEEKIKKKFRVACIQLIEETAQRQSTEIVDTVVNALAEATFSQSRILAKDVLQFAKHAKRASVSEADVLLAARRNADVQSALMQLQQKGGENQCMKRRRKDKGKYIEPDEETDFATKEI
ncbi:hypothetical protein CYMTET_18127 [Cymbomonas tetramitiformis]|uniref:Centromere protein S n=1 Tax=Cymbomonas tetramitiformis TaxID=36881 RepID=A0AAE0G8K3_9CHLO|nr:hypothetical protein CYMTET_18127 [Cymbomonas tetramitiformis]